ncbi:MAG: ATP synthase F0 subunit B [Candidatus Portnoybacteria bacterium RIFCSPLOWO2_12_FULL_39_9]|uniref:ATP synthase subunit b n=1 Tax=Candidatus Portnoybacteria bacterium RIFCSPHIGHO2_12_FULL_38_9 TaxID=1801997 RepID=A0A1G2FHY1_9BACT|nr:MAG: ATP synthase F0 subunit B [Candidatus Portnoybacteria bacterium RBG_13_40_8]OGZ37040.1 MAG: ATP synthase F0 subunit B [Candidatus Portnoybacteria bacterium RIFCSPHIGHO2_02_FULL_39_12]OGZ37656.1 MAG: ATP synthase F0 subunit B [Candidatus Portnoybacteria bacterium RIFCSPHIGHO2_12_FULL_38_9]OGZ37913.1 MAG: ATP synthase F0 subunit B [Candidatus Portnoybacteria bacterium RIFCSPLOWO2_01_FULL_38_39]OGZ40876.1 MAG: ATP synthase F0 subunit B [Candidatus Portnoybacteria bacterium RIFCSPLOWO2_12_F
MELLFEKLGLEPHILIAQIINFLILIFILHKFLYKPLIKFLDKRQGLIEKGLNDAKKAKEELSKIQTIKEEKIIEGEKQAAQIIESSKKTAEQKSGLILKEAQEKSEDIIKEAKEIAREEKKEAKQKLKEEIRDLVALASSKILEKNIGPKENEEIVSQQLELLSEKP